MPEIILRPYQHDAVKAVLDSIEVPGNDLCVLPTGAGKSIVTANVAKAINNHILITQPSKEILDQNCKKLLNYVDKSEVGIYSASFNSREIKKFTFATIQSIYKKPKDFEHFGLVLIDEAHTMDPKNLDGMFTSFLREIGNPKTVGFTATPYRNMIGYHRDVSGQLYAATTLKLINRIKPQFWKRIVYNINNRALVNQKYLCPLVYYDRSVIRHEDIPYNKSRSDFDLEQYEITMEDKKAVITDKLKKIIDYYGSTLVFCSSLNQAYKYSYEFPGSECVSSKTKAKDRDRIIEGFKDGSIKCVFNVGVLTTGFDHPSLRSIVLLRPTKSLSLYYQMLGRGVRIYPGKTHCAVIDFTGTVKSLGEIESIVLVKEHMWELRTSTGSWHNRELYKWAIDEKPKPVFQNIPDLSELKN